MGKPLVTISMKIHGLNPWKSHEISWKFHGLTMIIVCGSGSGCFNNRTFSNFHNDWVDFRDVLWSSPLIPGVNKKRNG